MKKITKKFLGMALIIALLFSAAACGKNPAKETKETNPESTQPSSTKTESAESKGTTERQKNAKWSNDDSAEITILINGDNSPNEDNMVLQALEKKTNTQIKMIYVSNADKDTKLNALVAAGDMPDLFFSKVEPAYDLKEEGLLADVSELLKEKAPNVMEETKDLLKKVPLNKDGVYMVPNANTGYGMNVIIRTDWLKKLDLDMPTDLDSFAKLMHEFTYNDPNGNGEDDNFGYSMNLASLTGINGSGTNIFGAFGIAKGRPMVMDDGTVTTWVKHPNFLKAIKYIKDLIKDGVCEPDYITIPNLAMFEKLWIGTSGCIEWEAVGPTNNWYPGRYTENPLPTFDFAILKGPDGKAGAAAMYPNAKQGWVFSAACKNLEGAARIANFCMTEEGSDLLTLGVEDVMYKWVDKEDGKVERLGEYKDDATHRANGAYCYQTLFTPASPAEYRTLNALTRKGIELASQHEIDWAYIPEISKVYTEHGSDMDQLVKEMIAELLTDTDDADLQKVYDKYMSEWDSIGGKEWEQEMTELWDAQNK